MKVIAAMPAYNEGKYIVNLVKKAKKYADAVIVADDGSINGTARLACGAGAMVMLCPKNTGYGSTTCRILDEARSRKCDVLVVLDADNQHDPDDIPKLAGWIISGYDVVIGKRDRKDVPPLRYVGGRILSLMTALVSGGKVVDSQSGFKVFSRRALEAIRPRETGMAITSEIVIQAFRKRLKVKEVPISIRYSEDSSTYNPFVQGFYTMWRLAVMWARRK